jgi:hypothetical protein
MPQHAGWCLKPRQDRGPELRDECPILPLHPSARSAVSSVPPSSLAMLDLVMVTLSAKRQRSGQAALSPSDQNPELAWLSVLCANLAQKSASRIKRSGYRGRALLQLSSGSPKPIVRTCWRLS